MQLEHTVTNNISIHVFAYLEKGWPLGIILKVEVQLIRLRQRIQVALGEFVDIIRVKASESRHGVPGGFDRRF